MPTDNTITQFDHFIPVSTTELIRRLQQEKAFSLSNDQLDVIHALKQLLSFQFYQKLVEIKSLYLPLNPDNELKIPDSQITDPQTCIDQLRELLTAANYSELNQQQIQRTLQIVDSLSQRIDLTLRLEESDQGIFHFLVGLQDRVLVTRDQFE